MPRLGKHLKLTKELVDFYGYGEIAQALGYKTPNTVRTWFSNGAVPKIAQVYIEKLHEEMATEKAKKQYMKQKKKN